MSLLQSPEQIESVDNLNHRAVLMALRDTNYNISEIAARLKIKRTTIYYIANKYLPVGFLQNRSQILLLKKMSKVAKDRHTSETDMVTVVPDINTKRLNSVQNRPAITSA